VRGDAGGNRPLRLRALHQADPALRHGVRRRYCPSLARRAPRLRVGNSLLHQGPSHTETQGSRRNRFRSCLRGFRDGRFRIRPLTARSKTRARRAEGALRRRARRERGVDALILDERATPPLRHAGSAPPPRAAQPGLYQPVPANRGQISSFCKLGENVECRDLTPRVVDRAGTGRRISRCMLMRTGLV
jgi:hypothetical protein